jgi:hypothetical protein
MQLEFAALARFSLNEVTNLPLSGKVRSGKVACGENLIVASGFDKFTERSRTNSQLAHVPSHGIFDWIPLFSNIESVAFSVFGMFR